MRVVIADIRQDHLDTAMRVLEGLPGAARAGSIHAIRLDVSDRAAMADAAAETVRVFGKVHLLCNNAGIGVLGSVKDASFDDWDWVLGVNLHGVFNGVREFLPYLRAHGEGGHVLSTASIGGLIVSSSGGVYSTGKFGVVAMMQCLREDLVDEHIGVSVLCPIAVRSNIHEAEQMRPERFSHSGYDLGAPPPAQTAGSVKDEPAAGMDPLDVGRHVLRAIARNDYYIFTQRFDSVINQRRDAVLASLPDEPINRERLALDLKLRREMPER